MNSTILVAMNYVKNRPVLQTYRPVKRLQQWVPVTFRLIKIDGKWGFGKLWDLWTKYLVTYFHNYLHCLKGFLSEYFDDQ